MKQEPSFPGARAICLEGREDSIRPAGTKTACYQIHCNHFKQVGFTVCELHLNEAAFTFVSLDPALHTLVAGTPQIFKWIISLNPSHLGQRAAQRWSWLQTPLSRTAGWVGSPPTGYQHSAEFRDAQAPAASRNITRHAC